MTEFTRLGEIRRSMEQTAIWESPERSYTTGFIKGFNQSVKRTAVGVYSDGFTQAGNFAYLSLLAVFAMTCRREKDVAFKKSKSHIGNTVKV